MKLSIAKILFALLFLVSAWAVGIGSPECWAYNFTINSLNDAPDANPGDTFCRTAAGECTLRAAIQEANSFPIFHNITLPKGNYLLSLGELLVTEKIYIYGSGQEVTDTVIDSNGASRIFNIKDGVALIINNMRLRNGSYTAGGDLVGGGALYNQGELEALNVTFVNNQTNGYGGAVFNDGILTLNYCTFIGNQAINGGGLFNNGTADIYNVAFTNNTASGNGGAVYNNGSITMGKTTLRGSAASSGGGLFNNGIMDLINNTISGNVASVSGGGVHNGTADIGALATMLNVTISNNNAGSGGGLLNGTGNTLNLKNTILSGNTSSNCSGTITSNGHNLELGTSCGLGGTGDLHIDPQLGSLDDNGGPTWTQILGNGDAKNVADGCPPTDQRGYPREADACDIGAYEDTIKHPIPAITTLDPNWKQAGTSDFKLIVNGYTYGDGVFVEGKSTVIWNGSFKETKFLNKSKLEADITAADIASAGSVEVKVFNPAEGGGFSNTVIFAVTSANPPPTITTISPNSRPAGGPPFTLTVNGGNFLYDVSNPGNTLSVVLWNGIARPTFYISPTQLEADIPAGDIRSMGTALITVSNSPPGGGVSNPPVTFTIGPPIIYLPLILRN